MKYFYQDVAPARFNPALDEQTILAANRLHDSARHVVSMDRKAYYCAVDSARLVFKVRRVK
jgi:hypothetical protein